MNISTGINAYRNFQTPRKDPGNSPSPNGNLDEKTAIANTQKSLSPEKNKDEGKTDNDRAIPPANGLGSIFDIKA